MKKRGVQGSRIGKSSISVNRHVLDRQVCWSRAERRAGLREESRTSRRDGRQRGEYFGSENKAATANENRVHRQKG